MLLEDSEVGGKVFYQSNPGAKWAEAVVTQVDPQRGIVEVMCERKLCVAYYDRIGEHYLRECLENGSSNFHPAIAEVHDYVEGHWCSEEGNR